MQIFKFRAWDISGEKPYMLGPYDIKDSIWNHKDIRSLDLMQFTGFNDKNDKEIYKGDKLKANGTHTFTVFWNKTHGQWYVSFIDLCDKIFQPLAECILDCKENYGGIEVIGNIHEGGNNVL